LNDSLARLCMVLGILILMITLVFALEIMYENLTNTLLAETNGGEYSTRFYGNLLNLGLIVLLSVMGGGLIARGVRP